VAEWEIAIVQSLTSRVTIWRNVPTEELGEAWGLVWAQTESLMNGRKRPGILITRMDMTPEAKRQKWTDTFYDLDKRGYKRRRFKKTPIEKDWEEFFENKRKAARATKLGKNKLIAKETR
jgi:hypothetical protein